MLYRFKLIGLHKMAMLGCVGLSGVFLQTCALADSISLEKSKEIAIAQTSRLFVPAGAFGKQTAEPTQSLLSPAVPPAAAITSPVVPSSPLTVAVLLYASPTTENYFVKAGISARVHIQQWEVFLRKYKIPFQVLASVDKLETAQPGVLLLPSSVALSEREKRAVVSFRAKGGGVLATWLTGVRGEKGEWEGFGFMENALDAKVVGNTEADENDNFMMPNGDSPVTHSLPAGLRIWLERPKDWYSLRFATGNSAAQIMDWSRTFVTGKPTSTLVFDERIRSSGRLSRSVVLGYPERLWLTAEPKFLEAMAHNSLMWLLRQPNAYLSAWPYPYKSAFVLAVDSADTVSDVDVNFAQSLEREGVRATYYLLSENAVKSAEKIKKIKALGHEIGYLGDRFVGFKNQPSATQKLRLNTMVKDIKSAGIEVPEDTGFHAPMELFDKNTEKLLAELSFGHYIAFMDSTDARLPFFSLVQPNTSQHSKSLIILPRTQNGPEDSIEESNAEVGLKNFLNELELSEKMGGLSVVRTPNQSSLTTAQLGEILKYLKVRKDQMWLATSRQVADWWRERERVIVKLGADVAAPQLTVTVEAGEPLQHAATVWINLPQSGSTVRLLAHSTSGKLPKIAVVDKWRAAIMLDGLTPGKHQWSVYFDYPTAAATATAN